MKRFLIIVFVFFFSALVVSAGEEAFFDALRSCSAYSSSGTSTVDSQTMKFKNRILGWQGDKCVYKENVSFGGVDACVTCRLTRQQIAELVEVMDAFSTLQKYSKENIDTSSLDAVKDNPVVKAWNKYLQDSSVCRMKMLK